MARRDERNFRNNTYLGSIIRKASSKRLEQADFSSVVNMKVEFLKQLEVKKLAQNVIIYYGYYVLSFALKPLSMQLVNGEFCIVILLLTCRIMYLAMSFFGICTRSSRAVHLTWTARLLFFLKNRQKISYSRSRTDSLPVATKLPSVLLSLNSNSLTSSLNIIKETI